MEKLKYELPSYNANPDVPRELDILARALDQQMMTIDDRDDLELRFQEQLEEMRSYITSLSESNAVPTLYQLSTDLTIYKYQSETIETLDDLEAVSIFDLVGNPLDQAREDDIGEYIQIGSFTFMITKVIDMFTYGVIEINEPYQNNGVSLYDKNNLRDFDLVCTDLTEEQLEQHAPEIDGKAFVLYYDQRTPVIGVIVKPNEGSFYSIELNYIDIPLFSVFYSKLEKIFKMWDGHKFIDFGQTFLPQSETYTKDEIDDFVGQNSNEISKREYVFQSGTNVFIDRVEPENPVLNVLNFDAMDKTKDAITSFIAKKNDDINGYQITLNTLSTNQSGGFKVVLPDIQNDELEFEVAELKETVQNYGEVVDLLKDELKKTFEPVVLYENASGFTDGSAVSLAENVYNFRYVMCQVADGNSWVKIQIEPERNELRGFSVWVNATSRNTSTQSIILKIENDGLNLKMLSSSNMTHMSSSNHNSPAAIVVRKIVGYRV